MLAFSSLLRSLCVVGVSLKFIDAKPLSFLDVRARSKGFETLSECSVSYDNLEQRCSSGVGAISAEPEWHDNFGRPGGLVGDAEGDGSNIHGKVPYSKPHGLDGEEGWDYHNHGEDWGHLGECGSSQQSPVDLPRFIDVRGQTKHLLWFDYYLDPDLEKDHRAKIINDGHGLSYTTATNGVDLGYVKVGDKAYTAAEYHFHAPSEHTIDGAVFPLEVQIINKEHAPKDKYGTVGTGIAGVSVLFREGASNRLLAALKDGMNGQAPVWSTVSGDATGTISGIFADAFDLEALIPKSGPEREHSFYNYAGSLTQPPCTSGVDWWVLSTPITATREEIRFIRKAIFASESTRHGNARATMPMEDRGVFAGITGFSHAIKFHNMPENLEKDAFQKPRGYSSQDMPWGPHWETEITASGPAPAPGPASPAAPAPYAAAPPSSADKKD